MPFVLLLSCFTSIPFATEVRDLFGASLLTDRVIPDEHENGCVYMLSGGEERCTCPFVPVFYLGQRAIPEVGFEGMHVTGSYASLDELDAYCEREIDAFRARAPQKS